MTATAGKKPGTTRYSVLLSPEHNAYKRKLKYLEDVDLSRVFRATLDRMESDPAFERAMIEAAKNAGSDDDAEEAQASNVTPLTGAL